jgi:hypothetical protein
LEVKFRRNLSESLEQYAARFEPPLPPDQVRATWRIQGLRLLSMVPLDHSLESFVPLVEQSIPRIAPGVACPTASIWGDPLDREVA